MSAFRRNGPISKRSHLKNKVPRADLKRTNTEAKQDTSTARPAAKASTIAFERYLVPEDADDLDEARRIDAENARRHVANTQRMPAINGLLRDMGLVEYRNPKPCSYYETALDRHGRRIREPDYKTVKAVEWLAQRTPPLYPVRDYPVNKAAALADKMAMEAEVRRLQQTKSTYDITELVAPDHAKQCDCGNRWDGRSATCAGRVRKGTAARVCWRVDEDKHHFLDPCVQPFVF